MANYLSVCIIPFAISALVGLWRLMAAPYWLWKEEKCKLYASENKLVENQPQFQGEIERITGAVTFHGIEVLIAQICVRNIGESGTARDFRLKLLAIDDGSMIELRRTPSQVVVSAGIGHHSYGKDNCIFETCSLPIAKNCYNRGWMGFEFPQEIKQRTMNDTGGIIAVVEFKDVKNTVHEIYSTPR